MIIASVKIFLLFLIVDIKLLLLIIIQKTEVTFLSEMNKILMISTNLC
jgi:hypothetical protein